MQGCLSGSRIYAFTSDASLWPAAFSYNEHPLNEKRSLCLRIIMMLNVCACSVMSISLRPHGLCVAYQAPLSIGLSRQEYQNGLSFPPPGNLPKWSEVKWKSLSCVRLFATPSTVQSMEFSRPEYWSGQPFPSPGDLPNPGIKPGSLSLQADSGIKPASPALQADHLPLSQRGSPQGCSITPKQIMKEEKEEGWEWGKRGGTQGGKEGSQEGMNESGREGGRKE